VPEIGFACAGGDDQLVIRDAAVADQYGAPSRVDTGDSAEDHVRVYLTREDATDRRRYIGRRQGRGGDLIKQWLEEVVVAPIDDGDVGRNPREPRRRG